MPGFEHAIEARFAHLACEMLVVAGHAGASCSVKIEESAEVGAPGSWCELRVDRVEVIPGAFRDREGEVDVTRREAEVRQAIVGVPPLPILVRGAVDCGVSGVDGECPHVDRSCGALTVVLRHDHRRCGSPRCGRRNRLVDASRVSKATPGAIVRRRHRRNHGDGEGGGANRDTQCVRWGTGRIRRSRGSTNKRAQRRVHPVHRRLPTLRTAQATTIAARGRSP